MSVRGRRAPSPHSCFHTLCVLRHCLSCSQLSVKRTQDAVCEASFWLHASMATPTKQQRAQAGQAGSEEKGAGKKKGYVAELSV